MPRAVLLFGAGGRLGTALSSRFSALGRAVTGVPWAEAKSWAAGHHTAPIVERFTAASHGTGRLDIVFANGNTDPAQPSDRLIADNLSFPLGVIAATRHFPDARYVTLGTVLESFDDLAERNPYVASKRMLANRVAELAAADLAGRICHVRLHTLYGGTGPAPHMFLGQMLAALRAGRAFPMSEGKQLREYHHVDDVAGAIARLLDRGRFAEAVIALSSGQPVRLADLARAVFTALGRLPNLQIGALPTQPSENFGRIFAASPPWLIGPSRDPCQGVSTWLQGLLGD